MNEFHIEISIGEPRGDRGDSSFSLITFFFSSCCSHPKRNPRNRFGTQTAKQREKSQTEGERINRKRENNGAPGARSNNAWEGAKKGNLKEKNTR